jgi:hypothetical protein
MKRFYHRVYKKGDRSQEPGLKQFLSVIPNLFRDLVSRFSTRYAPSNTNNNYRSSEAENLDPRMREDDKQHSVIAVDV